jgi:hypothetical protein
MLDFDPLSDSADDLSRSFDAFGNGDSELGAFAVGAGLTGALLRWWGKKNRDQELRDSNLRGSVSQENSPLSAGRRSRSDSGSKAATS